MRKIKEIHGRYIFLIIFIINSQILIGLSFSFFFFWVSDLRFSEIKRLRDDGSSPTGSSSGDL